MSDVQVSFCVAGARDCAPCQKSEKREGFLAFPKTMAVVGHLQGSAKMHFPRQAQYKKFGGPGADFLRGGRILEHQIFRFAEVILRDRCGTSYDLASPFRGRRSSLDKWTGRIAKHIGTSTRPSALHSTFHL